MDCLDDFAKRFQKTWFCDDLVAAVLKDIIDNPKKYEKIPVIFVGEKSPLDYCAISLRGMLNNRGISGISIGTADSTNGLGNYFNVDDYLRQGFAASTQS